MAQGCRLSPNVTNVRIHEKRFSLNSYVYWTSRYFVLYNKNEKWLDFLQRRVYIFNMRVIVKGSYIQYHSPIKFYATFSELSPDHFLFFFRVWLRPLWLLHWNLACSFVSQDLAIWRPFTHTCLEIRLCLQGGSSKQPLDSHASNTSPYLQAGFGRRPSDRQAQRYEATS